MDAARAAAAVNAHRGSATPTSTPALADSHAPERAPEGKSPLLEGKASGDMKSPVESSIKGLTEGQDLAPEQQQQGRMGGRQSSSGLSVGDVAQLAMAGGSTPPRRGAILRSLLDSSQVFSGYSRASDRLPLNTVRARPALLTCWVFCSDVGTSGCLGRQSVWVQSVRTQSQQHLVFACNALSALPQASFRPLSYSGWDVICGGCRISRIVRLYRFGASVEHFKDTVKSCCQSSDHSRR